MFTCNLSLFIMNNYITNNNSYSNPKQFLNPKMLNFVIDVFNYRLLKSNTTNKYIWILKCFSY